MGITADQISSVLSTIREKGMPVVKGVAEVTPAGVSVYSLYAIQKQKKKAREKIKKGKKQAEERQTKGKALRRPSKERGVL